LSFTGTVETPVTFEATLAPDNFAVTGPAQTESFEVVQPSQRAQFNISIPEPKLWWTWDRGDPNLYRLTLRAFAGGHLLGESVTRFGFRTVEVDPKTRQWRLNGQPIFLRGTNYISSQWFSEMTPAKFGFDLELMKHAYINAVRVHAHLEPDAFYQQCDEKGVLVWQDFPLQWGYDDGPAFQAEATRQAVGMVAWLYNHPSIGAWSLQNEPPFDADWMKYKYPDYRPEQNKALNEALASAVSAADTSRWVHSYSTTGEHQWLGWYAGSWKDFAQPSKESMVSEYGAQALPGLSSLRKMFSEAELWPKSDAAWAQWEYRNFQRHETFDLAGVRQGSNIQEWIDNTQQYQAKLTQFAAENYRRQKNAPVTAIFQFLFNEDWPSVNWGVVDYWRNPKPGYEALRTAYQPVLPSIAWTEDRWSSGAAPVVDLWIVNDLARGFPGARLTWTLRDASGVLREATVESDIAADGAGQVCQLTFADLADGSYELLLRLKDRAGIPLGENRFAFSVGLKATPESKP
jgi:beta-mannosidase